MATEIHLPNLLQSLGLQEIIVRNNDVMACCPNHSESRPSWGISLSSPHAHGCFACGFSGNLFTLLRYHFNWPRQEVLSLLSLEESFSDKVLTIKLDDMRERSLNKLDPDYILAYYPTKKSDRYMTRTRGIPLSIIRKAGVVHHIKDNRVLFPWWYKGELRAITGRTLSKSNEALGKMTSYHTTDGDTGLRTNWLYTPFGFIDRRFPLVLVEGEIDALSVATVGFKNVAALGYGHFSERHRYLILNSGVKELILFFDNDAAGAKLFRLVKESLGNDLIIKRVCYPSSPEKLDPAKLDAKLRKKLLLSARKSYLTL